MTTVTDVTHSNLETSFRSLYGIVLFIETSSTSRMKLNHDNMSSVKEAWILSYEMINDIRLPMATVVFNDKAYK